jgi:NAD(P)-dependent dehydrogenase (short-subunit alcohol dehydrogenase family)
VAIALADAGFTVFGTGRTIEAAQLPDSVTRLRCDHQRDEETSAVFARVSDAGGALDLLVNSAWGGYERMVEGGAFTWSLPFWQQPLHRWTSMMDAGVRAAFVCSAHAAGLMVPRGRGLARHVYPLFDSECRPSGTTPSGGPAPTLGQNTGTGYLLNLTTAAASTLKPFHVSVNNGATDALTVLAREVARRRRGADFIGPVIAALAAEPGRLTARAR